MRIYTHFAAYTAVTGIIKTRCWVVGPLLRGKSVQHHTPLREIHSRVLEEIEKEDLA